jgi:NAD(P)-dependent dehydrogenase (short-subunit alcohol dehydrogenase family)
MGVSIDDANEFHRERAEKYPVGRVGQPEDIANGVLYLASEESSFVTGINLVLDGGGLYI